MLQQRCIAFVGQNKWWCSSGRQGADLKDHFQKIKCAVINKDIIKCPTFLKSYLWVCLVLHALNKHALDNLHIMLLLVAKDSREVPKTRYRHTSATAFHPEHMHSLTLLVIIIWTKWRTWDKVNSSSPEYVQGSFSQAHVVRVDRVKQKLENLWPLVIPIII